ncbi:hypothetical protein T484DRAFT_1831960 [Baffinella frigidus]|nr:hypothetical protein T484DRAFT_1831960 [Cryptophyta sp. CCMP2293]
MMRVPRAVVRSVQGYVGRRGMSAQVGSAGGSVPGGTLAGLETERAEAATGQASKCGIEWRGMGRFDLHGSAHQRKWLHTESAPAADSAAETRTKPAGMGYGAHVTGLMSRATTGAGVVDPFKLMEPQLKQLTENLKGMVESDNEVMSKVARYFFDVPGKRFRPALVLLVAQASPSVGEITQGQQRLAEITEVDA